MLGQQTKLGLSWGKCDTKSLCLFKNDLVWVVPVNGQHQEKFGLENTLLFSQCRHSSFVGNCPAWFQKL